jgi:uncharacterized cupredoxin-like copper-binding protein
VSGKPADVRIDVNTAGAQPAARSETELTMSRPLNALRAAAVALASLSLVLAACGASATPGLTFNPVAVVPTAVPSVAPSAEPILAPTIALSEWKVVTASTIKAGTVKFTITNVGTIAHELLVFKSDLSPSAYPTDPAGDIIEEGGGVNLVSDGENVDPAGTQTRSVDLAPGTYLFVCNIPGHFKAGMFTVVTVTP